MTQCSVNSCSRNIYVKKMCERHYKQVLKFGSVLKRTTYDPNEIIECKDYLEIVIYNQKNVEVCRTKIDKKDLEKIKIYKWSRDNKGYVRAKNKNGKLVKIHRILLDAPSNLMVDHKNHDPLDNRRSNLRLATRNQNQWNSSFKGYTWNKKSKKWHARVSKNKKTVFEKFFDTEEEAKQAIARERKIHFGNFAPT